MESSIFESSNFKNNKNDYSKENQNSIGNKDKEIEKVLHEKAADKRELNEKIDFQIPTTDNVQVDGNKEKCVQVLKGKFDIAQINYLLITTSKY